MAGELDYLDETIEATGVKLESDTSEDTTGVDSQNGTSTESGTESQTAAENGKVQGADGKDNVGGTDNNNTKQGKEKAGKNSDPADPPGTLTLSDGTKVKGGAERRFYEQAQLYKSRETQAKAELNTANQHLQNYKTRYEELSNSVKQIGLDNPDGMKVAVGLYKDLQTNPLQVVTNLLAELKNKGYDLSSLGSMVDTKAITELLDRKLTPSAEQQRSQSQAELDQQIDQEINDLYSRFPDARTHEAILARVVEEEGKQGRAIPLVEAYFKLRENAINQGLDWSQPLGPQIQAKKQGVQTQQQQQTAPRTQGVPTVAQASEEIDPAKMFTPKSDSYADIVRASMQEAGMIK